MLAFAALLERLVLTPSRNAKLTLIVDYLRHTPDPSRGEISLRPLVWSSPRAAWRNKKAQ